MSVSELKSASTLTPNNSPYFSAGAGLMVGSELDVVPISTDFIRTQRGLVWP